MIKFTSKVRRGLGAMLDLGLAANIETSIAHNTRLGLPRDDRMRADVIADLRAAVAWIEQEAKLCAVEEAAPVPAAAGGAA